MEAGVQLLIAGLFGVVCALIAHSRGRSAIAWFFIGGFLCCFGLILLLVIPDLKVEQARLDRVSNENQRLRELLRKDRQVADSRHVDLSRRLETHDRALGIDTSRRDPLLGDVSPLSLLPESAGSPFSTIDWYYVLQGDAKGPVRFDELRALRDAGLVQKRTLIWHDGLEEWSELAEIPGLLEELHG